MATRIKTVAVCAGDYMRVHIFPVRNYNGGRRLKKYKPSSAAQERYNRKRAAMHFADILHANFTENDYALRLSYDGVDVDTEMAERALKNWLRRMKRAYQKRGVELRALWKTERGKNGGRVHHHVVINACEDVTDDQRLMRRIWNNGGFGGDSFVYIAPLEFNTSNGGFEDGGLTGLAKYYIYDDKPGKEKITACRYGRTRNLKEPEVREVIGALTIKEASYINETTDASVIEELYEGYEVRAVAPEVYDEESENARYCTGLFTVVYLQRKEMVFNCVSKRR